MHSGSEVLGRDLVQVPDVVPGWGCARTWNVALLLDENGRGLVLDGAS